MEEDRKMMSHQVEADNRNQWVKSIRERLRASPNAHFYTKKPPTIYRVPEHIRKGDESAYQPQIISIGPYHRGEKGLEAMEEHKWRYLREFFSRRTSLCLEKCLEEIRDLEVSARNCYSETIHLGSNEFVEMMVLDGCFIIELFLKHNGNNESDPIYNMRWMLPVIGHDMLLLENQIPFFILQHLFERVEATNRGSKASLEELALDFLRRPLFGNNKIRHSKQIHHLLHLRHSSLLPDSEQEKSSTHSRDSSVKLTFRKWKDSSKHLKHLPSTCSASSESSNHVFSPPPPPPPAPPNSANCAIDIQGPMENFMKDDPVVGLGVNKWKGLAPLFTIFKWKKIVSDMLRLNASSQCKPPPPPPKSIPGATELNGAGVKFKRKKEAESFLEVEFTDGVMLIPHLLVDGHTNSLFRNFIAFEQSYPTSKTHFTSYAFFMDCIVNTPKDVALLGQYKIIEHWLGTDGDVALLFNRLCCGVAIDNSYLSELFNEVTEYCKTSWHTWRACLMRDYFSNPWAIVSVAAAVLLLFIGIVQTFFAFMSYLRPT